MVMVMVMVLVMVMVMVIVLVNLIYRRIDMKEYISCMVCGIKIYKYGNLYRCPYHGCFKEDWLSGKHKPVTEDGRERKLPSKWGNFTRGGM